MSDTTPTLIPTTHKEKLPQGFSYPIGAEALSNALRGITVFDGLELTFSRQDTLGAVEYNEKLKNGGKVTLLEISYSEYFSNWWVRIHATPSNHAHEAREGLTTSLPAVKEKLAIAHENPSSFHLRIVYDLTTHTVSVADKPERTKARNGKKFRAPIR